MKIWESLLKSGEVYENLGKSIKIWESLWKSGKVCENLSRKSEFC